MTLETLPFTLPSLRAFYAAGGRPADVVREAARRRAADPDPGVFLSEADVDALAAQADALGAYDPSKPLWGALYAAKDNIDVAGETTTAGCPAYAYQPERDAFVVARLRAAGALMVGKTNLDQFATGLVGVRSPYPPPKNAIDPAIVPGGSSSGSAVATARGWVSFALGTDTAGSGRVPAALNNIVGLKPSLGALSASGVVPACRTLDTISIFAMTVDDAYDAYRVAAVFDPEDAYARETPVGDPTAPSRLTIGAPDAASLRFFGDQAQQASFEASLSLLAEDGAEIRPIDFTAFYAVAEMLYEGAWVAERYAAIQSFLEARPDALHPVTRRIIEPAKALSAADAFNGCYRLESLRRSADAALAGVDMLCVPSIPTFYTVADLMEDPIGPNARLGTYTNFVNLLGLCGLATPTPAREDGRPGSVTFLAKAGQDGLLAGVGRRMERAGARRLGATEWPIPPAAEVAPRAQPDEIEIAVCGAHMSGLPLNGQLTERGGRFLRAGETLPDYRFYALPGGPPSRPGLVRGAPGSGGAVAVEVWALPQVAIGALLAEIPAPLGLGTLRLADGTSPKGFLCEAAGIEGAEDVTALGDWRRVLARSSARSSAGSSAG